MGNKSGRIVVFRISILGDYQETEISGIIPEMKKDTWLGDLEQASKKDGVIPENEEVTRVSGMGDKSVTLLSLGTKKR